MLTTEFLSRNQIAKYGSWLKAQDPQTLHNYFGYSMGQEAIDSLVKQFECNPKNNHFLIAKVDGQWAGTIHLATHGQEVEFGVIVALQYRKQGIANTLMDEAKFGRKLNTNENIKDRLIWKHLTQKKDRYKDDFIKLDERMNKYALTFGDHDE